MSSTRCQPRALPGLARAAVLAATLAAGLVVSSAVAASPAQEAPVQETPAQEAPVQEAPVQETPVDPEPDGGLDQPPPTEATPELLVPGPTSPPTTEAADDDTTAAGAGGMTYEDRVRLIVWGLVAIAVVVAVLTFFYWRHTRPGVATGRDDPDAGPDDHAPTVAHGAVGTRHQSGDLPSWWAGESTHDARRDDAWRDGDAWGGEPPGGRTRRIVTLDDLDDRRP